MVPDLACHDIPTTTFRCQLWILKRCWLICQPLLSTFAVVCPEKKVKGPKGPTLAPWGLGAASNDSYRLLFLLAWLRAEAQYAVNLAAAGVDTRGRTKSVEQRRGLIFARQRAMLTLTCPRSAAMRLTGKHWDRGLTAEQRRAVVARDAADYEEELAALQAPAHPVVQAFPVV